MAKHDELLRTVRGLAASAPDSATLMQRIADHLHSVMPRFNSISFRLIDPADPGMLILGPYTGSFTPQPRLSFGQGLCGTAAATGKTVVVNNVAEDVRYLKASFTVKSEIVVPVFVYGKFTAELDIQSYFIDTFHDAGDVSFVEACANVVAKFMEGENK